MPLVHFIPTFGKCDTGRSNNQCNVWEEVMLWRFGWKAQSSDPSAVTSEPEEEYFAHMQRSWKETLFRLDPCTTHNYWRICQKHGSPEIAVRKEVQWSFYTLAKNNLANSFDNILHHSALSLPDSLHAHYVPQVLGQYFEKKLCTDKTDSFTHSLYMSGCLITVNYIFSFLFNFSLYWLYFAFRFFPSHTFLSHGLNFSLL